MVNEKLAVDVDALKRLIQQAGLDHLFPHLATQIEKGYFRHLSDRNRWIIQLAQSDCVSFAEIAACFGESPDKMGLSRALITYVLEKHGEEAVRKKGVGAQAKERLKEVESSVGHRLAEGVLGRAARDPSFWWRSKKGPWRRLKQHQVLLTLGFPPTSNQAILAETWRGLLDRRIIGEWTLVGVVLRHGLGEKDPAEYVRCLYHDSESNHRLIDVVKIINDRCRPAGVLEVSRGSLTYFMMINHIPFKNRGHGLERK